MRYALLFLIAFFSYAVGQDDNFIYEDEWGLIEESVWNDWNGSSVSVILPRNSSENSSSTVVVFNHTEIDLSLQDDIKALGNRLIDLISGMVGVGGSKNDTWTFVSFVTLAPLSCSSVNKVAGLFDDAMAATNPGAAIVSMPRRLGGLSCDSNGVCPCTDSGHRRKYVSRVMELSSRSQLKSVAYPLEEDFPYHVVIQPLPIF